MLLPRPLVLAVLGTALTLLLGPVAPAGAAPAAPTLSLQAPAPARAGSAVVFTATLLDQAAAPVAGRTVELQRAGSTQGTWTTSTTAVTDAAGVASLRVTLTAGGTTWRARWAGDGEQATATSAPATAQGLVLATTLGITAPRTVVDEREATVTLRWRASDGSPVPGAVTVQRRASGGTWKTYGVRRTDADGVVKVTSKPRSDTQWRATGSRGTWWQAASSATVKIDNVPIADPIVLPSAAPRPAALAAQTRATTAGADAVLTAVPDATWRSMVGRSWHSGCPVGRSGLRLLRINYWGFDGYRYRGEMVLSTAVAGRAAAALTDMYAAQLPIRRMYRVDRFGWSKRVHGADDHASMRADNTSAFNCRWVVNRPGVMSPHATGRAIDLNTWENPYDSATGWVPNSWWATRSHPRVAWRTSNHPVVKIWRAHGFRWTYGTGDSQHVDGRGTPLARGGFVG